MISFWMSIAVAVASAILVFLVFRVFLACKDFVNQWGVRAQIRDLRKQVVKQDARKYIPGLDNQELREDIEKLRQFIRDLQDSRQAVPSDASACGSCVSCAGAKGADTPREMALALGCNPRWHAERVHTLSDEHGPEVAILPPEATIIRTSSGLVSPAAPSA
ncbi:FtsB/FtsL family cell division protein [Leifsonia xyli]|uniref:hypothetical protein n=1 Tax=Leifsonia xyli TaxID=1575 RepID=UPI00118669E3|nr:hypothetical protein [Leifsonia xyli]